MKIKVKRAFQYQDGPRKVVTISPGIYEVPGELSRDLVNKILRFGKAEYVVEEKKAPENKLAEVSETKAEVEPVRRRSSRSKSHKKGS